MLLVAREWTGEERVFILGVREMVWIPYLSILGSCGWILAWGKEWLRIQGRRFLLSRAMLLWFSYFPFFRHHLIKEDKLKLLQILVGFLLAHSLILPLTSNRTCNLLSKKVNSVESLEEISKRADDRDLWIVELWLTGYLINFLM